LGHIRILCRTCYWPKHIQAFSLLVPAGAFLKVPYVSPFTPFRTRFIMQRSIFSGIPPTKLRDIPWGAVHGRPGILNTPAGCTIGRSRRPQTAPFTELTRLCNHKVPYRLHCRHNDSTVQRTKWHPALCSGCSCGSWTGA
jgi:hypothetical protein